MTDEHPDQQRLTVFEEEEGDGDGVIRQPVQDSDEEPGEFPCSVVGCRKVFDWKWERDNHVAWHESQVKGGGINGP